MIGTTPTIGEDTSVPRVITELHWYMTHEEYEALAPHGNTPEVPDWSDSETEGRRVSVEIALTTAQEWVRKYGARRARMGYYNNSHINYQLSRRELSMSRIKICCDDYRGQRLRWVNQYQSGRWGCLEDGVIRGLIGGRQYHHHRQESGDLVGRI